jgi:transcription termination factor NusA
MEVIVADDQLAQAIGRRGQNVKLASKLTGWKIDVRSVSVAEEQAKRARQSLEAIPGVEFTLAELLFQRGFRSAREVADATLEDLMDIEGLTAEKASEILRQAREMAEKLEAEAASVLLDQSVTDLDKLLLAPEIKSKLVSAGFTTIDRLVLAEAEQLLAIDGVTAVELDLIKQATDAFLKGPSAKGMEQSAA